jgi:hypothetical protein
MALTGDFDELRALRASMRELGLTSGRAQRDIAKAVAAEVKGLLKQEFATGEGPDGAWARTVRGKQALQSKRLAAGDFQDKPIEGGVEFVSKVSWLRAHQEGHTWPARSAGGQSLFFNNKGRLLKLGKLSKRVLRVKFVEEKITRKHTVRERVLPARPIIPEGGDMPPAWSEAISRGAEAGVQRWYDRATAA